MNETSQIAHLQYRTCQCYSILPRDPFIHLNLCALAQDLNHLLGALVDAKDQFFIVLFGLSWIECDGHVHVATRREDFRLEAHLQERGVCKRAVHTVPNTTENANPL